MINRTGCNYKFLALNVVLFAFEVLNGHAVVIFNFSLLEFVAQGSKSCCARFGRRLQVVYIEFRCSCALTVLSL